MKVLLLIVLVSLLSSCGSDSDNDSNNDSNTDTQSSFDLTVTNGGTVLGEGLNYSSSASYLDCIDPGFALINNLKNKIVYGVSSTVGCGGCDVIVKCNAGETVEVESHIWSSGSAGGLVGSTSGVCSSQGEFTATDRYNSGGEYLRITAKMGSETDVEYVVCRP